MGYSKRALNSSSRLMWGLIGAALLVLGGVLGLGLTDVRSDVRSESGGKACVGSACGEEMKSIVEFVSDTAEANESVTDNETSDAQADEEVNEVTTPQERIQADWEKLFDALVARQDDEQWKPSPVDVKAFKEAFDRLDAAQKEEQVPHAQNLLADSSFDLLKVILMDPKEPQEVLESIYNDLLNRPEELMYPILREVHEVQGHPLRAEIEELDVMLD